MIGVGCLAVLAGLGLARSFSFYPSTWLFLLSPAVLLLKARNMTALYLALILGLMLGLWRGTLYMQKYDRLMVLTDRQVTIQLTAKTDAVYNDRGQLEFTAGSASAVSPVREPLAGSFKISGFGLNMVYRGDRLQATGKLYAARGSNQAGISFAQIKRLAPDTSWINRLTRNLSAGMQNALPEPLASFALGLLIGQRTNLPQGILDQLTAVGLIHIVAVSGYNVTILARAAARLRLPSRYQQLVLSFGLIAVFVLITGFSASIVRAALVSALSLWAWFYGRQIRPVILIAFSAALTGMLNPFYVWGDLGWYLSFLAFFGVLVIAPLVSRRFFERPPKLLLTVVLETLAAELMTLPLIMLSFGQLSLVALAANVLVVPLIPAAMLFSAVAMVAGSLVPQMAGWLAWPAQILLTYMLDIVHLIASVPSALTHPSISLASMVLLYGAIMLVLLAIRHRLQLRENQVESS